MLNLQSISLAIAIVVAVAAFVRARSLSKRLQHMTESYWELRYEAGQLKSRVNRLEMSTGLRDEAPEAETPRPAATSKTTFVPLSSLKK